jgi:hypothetical protein
MRIAAAVLICSFLLPASLAAQVCNEAHWRWTEKTDLSLAGQTPRYTSINAMLSSWAIPEVYRGNASKCLDRFGRERTNYYLYGWVHRVKKGEEDGDWHMELTATRNVTPRDNCIVVEIPSPDDGSQYRIVRDQFDAILADAGVTINSSGDLSSPVRVKIVGPAFFDAEHRGARGTTNPPHGHGRCNSDSRALWELHPVYGVFKA